MADPRLYPQGTSFDVTGLTTTPATTNYVETFVPGSTTRQPSAIANLLNQGVGGIKLNATAVTSSSTVDCENISLLTLNSNGTPLTVNIGAPTLGKLLVIVQVDAGTDQHTVKTSGCTFDGTNDNATFDAQNETLVLLGVSTTRWVIVENIGSVGLAAVSRSASASPSRSASASPSPSSSPSASS